MNKYYKNSVLCGEIDYFCLLCEESFTDQAGVERHIRWENHRKKLKNNTYLSKFKGDFIIKFGDLFYCEVCNMVMPTKLKTSLHIAEPKHIENKQNRKGTTAQTPATSVLVKRDAGSIKISNIVIDEKQWNGIIDNQCMLCDMILDDVGSHLKGTSHVINLVQTRTVCSDGDRYYRKIGLDIFYCFTCREPSAIALFDDHWTSKEHLENKKKLSNNSVNIGAGSSTFSAEFSLASELTSDKIPEILQKLQDFQKEDIDINFEMSKATCKKCNFTPAFTAEAIMVHIRMHKQVENDSPGFVATRPTDLADALPSDPERTEEKENLNFNGFKTRRQLRAELAKFGKQNYIKLILCGSKGYCTLCESNISAHIKNFKQHIEGAKHLAHIQLITSQNKTESDDISKENQTKTLKEYLKNILFVKQMDDFWINKEVCIDKHSFVLIRHLENDEKCEKFKCFVCNDFFPGDEDQAHCQTIEHMNKLFTTKVLTSLKMEFVREIRPDLFHCGICNRVCPSWLQMKQHLASLKHEERREEQKSIAGITAKMYGISIDNGNTAEADITWMQVMGHRLL